MAAIKKTAKKKIVKKKTVKKKSVVKKKTTVTKKKAAPKKTALKKKVTVKKAASKKKVAIKKVAPKKKAVAKKAAPKKKAVAKNTGISKISRTTGSDKPEFTPYKPEKNEEYMNETQLEHFREILNNWKFQLQEEVSRTVNHMKEDASNFADPADRATQEEEFALELRTRDRERKLLRKIDSALQRIDDGTYGYCEETGEEIGIQRLEVRPVATLCLEAQERHEMNERLFRDIKD